MKQLQWVTVPPHIVRDELLESLIESRKQALKVLANLNESVLSAVEMAQSKLDRTESKNKFHGFQGQKRVIYEYMEKNTGKPFNRRDLSEKLGIDKRSVSQYLGRLEKEGRIEKLQLGVYVYNEK